MSVAAVTEAVEEVAEGAARFSRRLVVGGGIVLAAALMPSSAGAQQVAANAGNPPTAPVAASPCDALSESNPKAAIECRVRELKARGQAADARGASADARAASADARAASADARMKAADAKIGCVNEITALRRDETFGPKATEIARELVKASGKPVAELDPCILRDGVRAGLKQLKLLPGDRASLN